VRTKALVSLTIEPIFGRTRKTFLCGLGHGFLVQIKAVLVVLAAMAAHLIPVVSRPRSESVALGVLVLPAVVLVLLDTLVLLLLVLLLLIFRAGGRWAPILAGLAAAIVSVQRFFALFN